MMAERDLDSLARSTAAIVAGTDLTPLPDDESESLDLALRHAVLYLDAKVKRLREERERTREAAEATKPT